eukprot:105241_1
MVFIYFTSIIIALWVLLTSLSFHLSLAIDIKLDDIELEHVVDAWVIKECESIIEQIPIWDQDKSLRKLMLFRCVNRYLELDYGHWQHQQNSSNNVTQQLLIVLDLDEAVLFQRQWLPINGTKDQMYVEALSKRFNHYDVQFSFINFDSVAFAGGHLAVYRKHLMTLIDNNVQSADFVVYSMACKAYIIHHVITMEMYYNYVIAVSAGDPNHVPFKFERIILPMDVAHKSVLIMSQQMNLTQYDAIIIVDDRMMSNRVWDDQIPPFMRNLTDVYGVDVVPFELLLDGVTYENYNACANAAHVELARKRNRDNELFYVSEFVENVKWNDIKRHKSDLRWICMTDSDGGRER